MPKRRISRRLLSLLLVIAALLVGVGLFGALASLRKPPAVTTPPPRRYNVEVFDVRPQQLQELIPSFGTVIADREVVVSAQVSGTVQKMHPDLRVGLRVVPPRAGSSPGDPQPPQGDLLVEIDRQVYEQQVAQVRGRLDEVQAELNRLQQEKLNAEKLLKTLTEDADTAKKEYERIKGLAARGVATPSDLSQSLLDYRRYEDSRVRQANETALAPLRIVAAKQRETSLKADLAIAEKNLRETRVFPPFAGTLAEVFVDQGQYVRVGDPLVRLIDTSIVEVPLPVKLSDFARIAGLLDSGQNPDVQLSRSIKEPARWTGTIVRRAPQADERSRTINVFVRVDNSLQKTPLLPGSFVHARISGPVRQNAWVIPREALLGGRILVAVSRANRQKTDDTAKDNDTRGDKNKNAEPTAENASGDVGNEADQTTPSEQVDTTKADSPAEPVGTHEVRVLELPPGSYESLQTIVLVDREVFADLAPVDRQPVQVLLTNLDVLTDGMVIDIQGHTGLVDYLSQLNLPVVRVVAPE